MPPKKRTYKHLDAAQQASLKTERIRALEAEHFSNTMTLETVQALPEGEARDQQIEAFQKNLAQIEAALDVLDP